MPDDRPILVEPIPRVAKHRWEPAEGTETIDFLLNVVPEDARASVRYAAASILAKSISPNVETGHETGLVVGYVQSGKTMSFEAVASLACDNNFQVVIVIAGSSNSLLDQSTNRLRQDLRLDKPDRRRRWILFKNPSADSFTLQAMRDALNGWRDPDTPREFKITILITVLKHHQRLKNLADVVRALSVQKVPVLIIDDEADQASLNSEVTQGQESTTYRCLVELRQALSNHTYLQYTATPQAPLLISIVDSLSPNFVQVLEPSEKYVGGREFFADDSVFIRVIPENDVPTRINILSEPPESLLSALRVFMIGVAVGICQTLNTGNRSMLVHPSHRTYRHQEYYSWVCDVFENWKQILDLSENDRDKEELIEDFRCAYDDLAKTAGDTLPEFDALVSRLLFAFRNTRVLEVNARDGQTPAVEWRSAYGWILVGGQSMDRGFTVEGLTVTYMPRGIGMGNADSVQQRGRFFGYKRNYLGYCRLYLENGTLRAFQTYVEHEEDIRDQLLEFQENGRPLNEWKRAFILDRALQPCRHSVLEFDYIRGQFSGEWVTPRVVSILESDDILSSNRKIVSGFLGSLAFEEDEGHADRTDAQRHEVVYGIPLQRVIENLLVNIRILGSIDSQRNVGLLLQLSNSLEHNPDEICTVYRMSPARRRRRSVDDYGQIANLFQGEFPVQPIEQRGVVYPGDRLICDKNVVTVQIHTLDLTQEHEVVSVDVPVLAVWVPARLKRGWIFQEQP